MVANLQKYCQILPFKENKNLFFFLNTDPRKRQLRDCILSVDYLPNQETRNKPAVLFLYYYK